MAYVSAAPARSFRALTPNAKTGQSFFKSFVTLFPNLEHLGTPTPSDLRTHESDPGFTEMAAREYEVLLPGFALYLSINLTL